MGMGNPAVRVSYANRVDVNQPEIVAALRKCGIKVVLLNAVGNGCPDIACHWRGVWTFIEIKNPSGPPSSRNLTPDQNDFHREHAEARIAVCTTAEEAIRAARAMTEEPMPQCPLCPYSSPVKDLLADHMERKHGEQGDGKDEPAETPREDE